MDRALLHCDNCYKIPHMRAQGHVCRTNIPSNTAFRGFGGPQGMLLTEMMLDLSAAIMDRALLHCDNCYKIPLMRAQGHVCRTNIPSNTAFRGFGGPQGMLLTEMMVDRNASHVGKPVEVVRELNMYREGEKTHYGQVLEDCHARRCWQEVMANSD